MSVTFPVSAEAKAKPGKPYKYEGIDAFAAITKQAGIRPEAAGSNLENLLPNVGRKDDGEPEMHGLLRAIHSSFANHHPLVMSPDDIWLAIAQGFAKHVNANAKKLRKQFVAHEGKVYLEIERNSFVKGSASNDWQGGFNEFSDKIAEHIGKKKDLLVGGFTTTGPVERAASELVLMDAMKSYFDYGCRTCCGIPEITLLGEKADWQSILDRAHVLAEFECKPWVTSLTAVLKHFVDAFTGSADPKVWNSLYKDGGGSGGPYSTGFFNVLFPYLARGHANRSALGWENPREASSRLGWQGGGPNTGDFPSGLSSVPFKWIYYDKEFPMQFIGGFVGTQQDPETLALRAAIGWGIADRPAE